MTTRATDTNDQQERETPQIEVTPHPVVDRRISVLVTGYDQPTTIYWGDESDPSSGSSGTASWHTYPRAGAWQVQVYDVTGNTFVTQQLVVIRGGRLPKGYEIGRDEDNTQVVEVRFVDTADGTGVLPLFRVDWPNGKDYVTEWGVPGTKLRRAMPYGEHTVRIEDLTTSRFGSEQVTVSAPVYDPDYVVRRKPGGDAYTLELELTKSSAKQVAIQWSDGPIEIKDGSKGAKFEHTYPAPAEGDSKRYGVIVAYEDGTGESKSTYVTVPLA